jgi:hypothetical protein
LLRSPLFSALVRASAAYGFPKQPGPDSLFPRGKLELKGMAGQTQGIRPACLTACPPACRPVCQSVPAPWELVCTRSRQQTVGRLQAPSHASGKDGHDGFPALIAHLFSYQPDRSSRHVPSPPASPVQTTQRSIASTAENSQGDNDSAQACIGRPRPRVARRNDAIRARSAPKSHSST